MFEIKNKRICIIVGHYGSGKTEFSVNYAIKLAGLGKKTSLADLDIANPYFRSREKKELLESKGIKVYSNTFGFDITADLPAITASIKAPLEDKNCFTIVDSGGDDSGARILIQFKKYFTEDDCDIFCIVNANRPETATIEGAYKHIFRIQNETGLKITGIINNTHMIKETKISDIIKGYHLCLELNKVLGIPVVFNCCVKKLLDELNANTKMIDNFFIFPMDLIMRDSWLDL